ncbi:MAG: hypothetical protein ABIP48_14010 [Planctomycetota bacterium]
MAAICIIVLPTCRTAAGEFQGWEFLPQVERMFFDAKGIGILSRDKRVLVLERETRELRALGRSDFTARFKDNQPPPARIYQTGIERVLIPPIFLFASGGTRFISELAYCQEGCREHHRLWLAGRQIATHAERCNCIWSVELVDTELWLGTEFHWELGSAPAEGIVIQDLAEGTLIARIDTSLGLTGDLITTIRLDPFTNEVWVATNRGLDRIGRDHRVLESLFFYEDFAPETGRPTVFLSDKPRASVPLAVAARELSIPRTRSYYRAVQSIPKRVRDLFCIEMVFVCSSGNVCNHKGSAMLPETFNVLVPHFIEGAIQKTIENKVTPCSLMWFPDDRVTDFYRQLEGNWIGHQRKLVVHRNMHAD